MAVPESPMGVQETDVCNGATERRQSFHPHFAASRLNCQIVDLRKRLRCADIDLNSSH